MTSRRKGHDAERAVAAILRDALGVNVRRNLRQSRDGGFDIEVAGFALEVKRFRSITPAKVGLWWLQATDQADLSGLIPALAYRADRHPWAVRVPLTTLRPDFPDGLTVDLCVEGFVALAGGRLDPHEQTNSHERTTTPTEAPHDQENHPTDA